MEQHLTLAGARKRRVFAYTYLFLVLWNALTTWWVSYADLAAGIAAVVLNALLMCLPLMAFRQTKKRLGNRVGYLSLPVYWIAFEQLHLHWDLTWPWLTLGNGFAAAPQWVQWYEYTGFLGGSVWVWAVNLLFWLFRGSVVTVCVVRDAAAPYRLRAALAQTLLLPCWPCMLPIIFLPHRPQLPGKRPHQPK